MTTLFEKFEDRIAHYADPTLMDLFENLCEIIEEEYSKPIIFNTQHHIDDFKPTVSKDVVKIALPEDQCKCIPQGSSTKVIGLCDLCKKAIV